MTEHEQRYITERELRVCNLAIEWVMSRYQLAEAFVEQELKKQIHLLIKERREAEVKNGEKG